MGVTINGLIDHDHSVTGKGGDTLNVREDRLTFVDSGFPNDRFRFDFSGGNRGTIITLSIPDPGSPNGIIPLVNTGNFWTGENDFRDGAVDLPSAATFFFNGATGNGFYISAASTTGVRTLIAPDVSSTLAVLGLAQTFTTTQTISPATDVQNVRLQAKSSTYTSNILEVFDADSANAITAKIDAGGGIYGSGIYLIRAGNTGRFDAGSLTANRIWTFPDLDFTVMGLSGTQTVTGIKTFTGASELRVSSAAQVRFADSSTTSKKLFLDLSGVTASTNNVLAFSATAVRTWTFRNVPGSVVIVGDGANPPATGAVGKVDLTLQGGDIATTKLTDTTPAGFYEVSYSFVVTTSDLTAGVDTLTFTYTDDIGSTTTTTTLNLATASARATGTFVAYLASGNITYATTHTGIFGTAQYALRIRCRFLG